jgi:hypothetical protein
MTAVRAAPSHRSFQDKFRDPSMIRAALQRRQIAAITLLALPYYFLLITDFGHLLGRPDVPLNLVFNSMLDHLVARRFDVDPAIVGLEGFARDGRVFAYWGIIPALFRMPLLVSGRLMSVDVTLWSCLIAVGIALAAKLWTLRIVANSHPKIPIWMVAAATVALVFSGAQIGYLRASVYQEVCFWAGAFAAIFVAAAIRGLVTKNFDRKTLALMATMAGLTLLTRVSVAVGLYAALGLLLCVLLFRTKGRDWQVVAIPVAIMLLFVALCAFINVERWGHPATFADYNLYNYNIAFPDRLLRTTDHGLFNLNRLPFGLMYFLFPLWCLRDGVGHLLFEPTRTRLLDAIELPPSSFLLTDLLLVGLCFYAVWSVRRSIVGHHYEKLAIGVGLIAPPLLMLTAISMNYRYRMDFYPLIEFGGFLGLIALAERQPTDRAVLRRSIWAAVAVSVVASHISMALYRLSDLGPAQAHLQNGIVRYYGDQL